MPVEEIRKIYVHNLKKQMQNELKLQELKQSY